MSAGNALLIATALMAVSKAGTLEVGGRNLSIPEPEGYVQVTSEMPGLHEAAQKLVDPDNEILNVYVSTEVAAAARAGGSQPVEKYLVLKVQGNTKFVTLGSAEFEGLVGGVKSFNQMVTDELKSEMGDSFDPEAVVALKGVAVLPHHHESKSTFAHSMLIKQAALGGKVDQMMSATRSYANVGGKVLLFSAYGGEKDLDWTRTAAGAWTDAVVSGNPAAPDGGEKNGAGQSDREASGDEALKSGLIGAVVGAVLVFLIFFMKGRRKG